MSKTVEMFRVLRYVGTPEFIGEHIERRQVKGRRRLEGKYTGCFIEEAILGEIPVEIPVEIPDEKEALNETNAT